jgi:hypothetical protein
VTQGRKKPGTRRPKRPVSAGDRLRAAILDEFELSEAEAQLLEKAAATADLLERVEAEVAVAPLVKAGSRGQPVAHPLIETQVELGAHLVRLLGALGLPLTEDDPQGAEVSRMARKAAMARWHGRGRAG